MLGIQPLAICPAIVQIWALICNPKDEPPVDLALPPSIDVVQIRELLVIIGPFILNFCN
jgi:hypothetical protein